jgi:hypothetical protein
MRKCFRRELLADQAEAVIDRPPLTLREQLARAHPRPNGDTYAVLVGLISEPEYRRRINVEKGSRNVFLREVCR